MLSSIAQTRSRLEAAVRCHSPTSDGPLTVKRLYTLYLAHASAYYRTRHAASLLNNIVRAFEPMVMLYGQEMAITIGPVQFMAVRQWMIEQGWVRGTVEQRMSRIRQAWRWAASVKLLPESALSSLRAVPPLRYGLVPETDDVQPVPLETFEATLPFLRPEMRVMLRVMLYAAMRPGEVCDLTGARITTVNESCWQYSPLMHKGAYKRRKRTVWFGPRSILLLTPLLQPGFIFTTKSGRPWSTNLLDSAVTKACRRGGITHWFPNQIRHAAGTIIREQFGLEHAQAVLGHSRIETTQIYAEKSLLLAQEVARRIG